MSVQQFYSGWDGGHAKRFDFKRSKPGKKISDNPIRGHHKLH